MGNITTVLFNRSKVYRHLAHRQIIKDAYAQTTRRLAGFKLVLVTKTRLLHVRLDLALVSAHFYTRVRCCC